MASLTIEDGQRKINAAVFSQKLAQVSEYLELEEGVVISGKINKDFREQWQVVVDKIESVDKVKLKYAKFLKINLSEKNKNNYLVIPNKKEYKALSLDYKNIIYSENNKVATITLTGFFSATFK